MLAPLVMLSSVRKVATRLANQSLPDGERSFDESFHERCSKEAGEPVLNLWSAELTPGLMQKHESRAVRGFEYGGPSRTRTYDQGIMSPNQIAVFSSRVQEKQRF